jgi:hypothetical protein
MFVLPAPEALHGLDRSRNRSIILLYSFYIYWLDYRYGTDIIKRTFSRSCRLSEKTPQRRHITVAMRYQ